MRPLFRKIWSLGNAGVEVPLLVYRDGRTFEVTVTSGDRTGSSRGRACTSDPEAS